MSKLQELIKKLCPDGVEFRKLGEVCEIFSGKNKQKKEQGKYPVYGSTGIIAYCDNYQYDKEQLLIARVGANAGFIHIANGKYDVSDNTLIVDVIGTCNSIYIYYVLVNSNINRYSKGGGQPLVTASDIKKIEIPLPPLEVQNEIVRILDAFTAHTAELQAELQARKEQYEYYRNKLLTFDENDEGVKWMKLGEIYDMKAGKSIPASEISSVKTEEFQYPCYGGNGLRGYVSIFNQEGEKVLIGRQGALCGNVCFAENLFYATEHAVVVSDKGYCLPRYSFYLLTMMDLNQYKTAGAQPGLSVSRLEKISIPVPPLSEQKRIISILDKFESLVNDLSEGLPAEIAAVQEQYEYYRNKLLTFKRKS